ncbi:hypothetical protein SedNR2807_21510 [Citrobacter sedlakii]
MKQGRTFSQINKSGKFSDFDDKLLNLKRFLGCLLASGAYRGQITDPLNPDLSVQQITLKLAEYRTEMRKYLFVWP